MTHEGSDHKGRRIDEETTIDTAPAHAWAAFADPDELARWFVDRAAGSAEPGGQLTWGWDDYDLEQTLDVVEAEDGKRLVLSVTWGQGTPTLIEITIDPLEHGCVVRLVHSGFRDDGSWDGEYEGAKSGWTNALAHLRVYLEDYRGQDKRTLDLVRPAAYAREDVHAATRTPKGLAGWLGTANHRLDTVGDTVRIELENGDLLTGEVVSVTDWETSVTWQEVEGILTFQAFPGEQDIEQGDRMLGLRVTSWGSEDLLEPYRSDLKASLDRLVEIVQL